MTKKWITIGSIISLLVLAFVIIGSFGSSSQAAPTIQVTPAHVLKQVEIIQRAVVEIEQIFNSGMEHSIQADAQVSVAESVGQKLTKPKLYSPRQIDRPTIGNEKNKTLTGTINVCIEKANAQIKDPDMLTAVLAVLNRKNPSGMFLDYRKQVMRFFEFPNDRRYPSPLSPKQAAWARYIAHKLEYPEPYTIVELYPYGKPQR